VNASLVAFGTITALAPHFSKGNGTGDKSDALKLVGTKA